jgi:hypothetical protein
MQDKYEFVCEAYRSNKMLTRRDGSIILIKGICTWADLCGKLQRYVEYSDDYETYKADLKGFCMMLQPSKPSFVVPNWYHT